MSANNLRVRVARKTTEAIDIVTFELEDVDGGTLPSFSAGSHIDVKVPGSGLTRQYSLCNESGEVHRYVIGVLKDASSRGGSKAMHESINEGDVLDISTPKNHFTLVPGAQRSLLFAGGIGVTPILCMAERLATVGDDFEMHYCTRSLERTAFRSRIAAATFAPSVNFHFDDGAIEQKLNLEQLLGSPLPGTHVYVCGPKGFMDVVLGMARKSGWPESQLHFEFFSAEVIKLATDGEFDVKLASSGKLIRVQKDQTIVDALAAAGIEVATSCGEGICGTCVTRVLEGEPDHRDMFFMPDEHAKNDVFTPCCSRSKSPLLVLDL